MLHLCARIFVILDILRRKEGSEGSIGRHQMRVGLKHAPVPVLVTVAFDGGPRCVRTTCHQLIVESPFGHRQWIPYSQPKWLRLKDIDAVVRNKKLARTIIRHRRDISDGYPVHQQITERHREWTGKRLKPR